MTKKGVDSFRGTPKRSMGTIKTSAISMWYKYRRAGGRGATYDGVAVIWLQLHCVSRNRDCT